MVILMGKGSFEAKYGLIGLKGLTMTDVGSKCHFCLQFVHYIV